MEPTLKARQLVLVKRDVSSVQREDIVVFCINQSVYIKRIVAVAGDTVQLTDCRVYVNGVYVYPYTCDIDSQIEYHLEEGQYFVLGDNGEASIDSRVFGVISENQLLGKAIAF
jgi:signal peptidase I